MTDKDIMPLICIRCKKDIPLTYGAMKEVSYTHYSYCEDCLRKGLKALKAWDDLYKKIYDHHYEILKSEPGERRDAKLSLSNWILDAMAVPWNPLPDLPSAEPKKGKWIFAKYFVWECSECGKNPTRGMGYTQRRDELFRYCPYCGTEMEVKDE